MTQTTAVSLHNDNCHWSF